MFYDLIVRHLRIDQGELKPAKKRADGSLIFDGYLTRTGVFHYRMKDGSILREYRSPDEVFKAEALDSLQLVAVTNDHPDEFVDIKNAKQISVGAVGTDVRKDGKFIRATLAVTDAETIQAITDGKTQLSCGYSADVIKKSGISPDGEIYDAIQTNILYNHVAIVDRGRAGPEVRIRLDAAEMVSDSDQISKAKDSTVTLEQALLAKAEADKRADAAEQNLKTEKARADKAEGERDALQAQAAKAEKERNDAVASIKGAVKARAKLERDALAAAPKLDVADLEDQEIMIAVIKTVDGDDVDPKASIDYLRGRFDAVCKLAAKADKASEVVQAAVNASATTQVVDAEEAARAEAHAKMFNAYKVK